MLLTQNQRTLKYGEEREQRRNEGGWRSKLKDWKHISGGHRDRETAVDTATTLDPSSSSSLSDRQYVGRERIRGQQQREKARVHVPSSPGYSSFRENLYDKLRDAYDRENATTSSSFSGSAATGGRRTTAREVCVRRKPEEDIFGPENDPPPSRLRSSKRNVKVGRAEHFSANEFFRERGEREESNDENSAAYLRSFGNVVAKKMGTSSASTSSDATVRSSSAEAYVGSRRNRNAAEEYATSEEKKNDKQRTRSAAPSLNRSKLSLLKHKLVRRGSSADGRRRRGGRRAGERGSSVTTAKPKSKTSALVRTTSDTSSGVAKRLPTTRSIETYPKRPTSRSEKENDGPTIVRRGHSATTRRTPRPASRPPPPEYTPPPLEPTRTNVSHRPQKTVTGNVECTRRSGCPCDLCTGAVDPFTASEIASSSSAAKKPSTRTRFCSKCRKDISARIFSKHQRACNGQHGRQKGAAKKTGRRSNKKWALQSQQLREAMRAAREYKIEKAQGRVGSGSRCTRQGRGRQRNKRVPETSRPRAPPPSAIVDPSLVPCPHCGRTFNETAHARHVKHCKHSRSRPKRLVKGGGLSAGSRKARLKSKRGSGIGGGRRNSLGGSSIGRQY